MKSLHNLLSIFKSDVDKNLKRYLITNKLEDLKRIDRKDLVWSVYNASKEFIVAEDKYIAAEKNNRALRNHYNTVVENLKSGRGEGGSSIADNDIEHAVTKCEIKKKQLAVSDELVSVLQSNMEIKSTKFNELVNFLTQYDIQIEFSSTIMELNKTKAEMSKIVDSTKNSTLASDIDEVSKEYELDFRANSLVETKLNPATVSEPSKSLEDRIANL